MAVFNLLIISFLNMHVKNNYLVTIFSVVDIKLNI